MTLLQALILGIIQGATEFLPISSSGHLVMGQALLHIRLPGVAFEVGLHVATLLSVLLAYRIRVARLTLGVLKGEGAAWRYFGLLVLATLPAALVGLTLESAVEALFENPVVVGVALLVTGGILWSTRWAPAVLQKGKETPPAGGTGAEEPGSGPNPAPPGVRQALIMGLAQAFAIIPGISRSGTTVVAALWAGVEVEEAAAFSFLMAVPAILGAAVLMLPDLAREGAEMGMDHLLVGSAAAAVVGILAIWTFVAMLKRRAFHRFGPYCWAVGALFLLYLALGG